MIFLRENKFYILKFLSCGLVSAIVYFLSFRVFYQIFSLHYQSAISFSYILSVIVHFVGNRYFTFKSTQQPFIFQINKYGMMVLFNYFVTLAVSYTLVSLLHFSPYLGIFFSIGATTMSGFLMSKFWVFRIE